MPLHLVPQTRRQFLKTTVAGGAAFLACQTVGAVETESKTEWWALLADTHIAGDPSSRARGVKMFDNLNLVVNQVLAEKTRPAGVIINGDCAYLKGLAADYATLSEALQRLSDADVPVHMTMGNHDDRGPFYEAFRNHRPDNPLVRGKHVSIVSCANANLFLVDSLLKVNQVTGEIGRSQIDWLAKALDTHSDKPAIVFGHHNFQFVPEGANSRITGVNDSQELIDVLHKHPHVHAYVFGHTHDWKVRQSKEHLHLINLPPCAYVFNASRPNGWVRAEVGQNQLTLELRALDRTHAQHGQKHELSYRVAAKAKES